MFYTTQSEKDFKQILDIIISSSLYHLCLYSHNFYEILNN